MNLTRETGWAPEQRAAVNSAKRTADTDGQEVGLAITAFPFDSQDSSEDQFSRLMSEAVDTGIVDSVGGLGFQIIASEGMSVSAIAGTAVVRGFLGYTLATEGPVLVANADPTYARHDLVVLRLDRNANAMTLAILKGNATPDPIDPALTDAIYELPLARLTIPAGASAMLSDYITDMRRFVGSTTGAWTTSGRPTAPRKGKLGLNATLGKWEFYLPPGGDNGWQLLIPDTMNNSTKMSGLNLAVTSTVPAGLPTTDRIWIQPRP